MAVKKKQVLCRFSKSNWEQIKRISERTGVPANSLILREIERSVFANYQQQK